MPGGSCTVLQLDPVLPADETVMMPAARCACTAANNVLGLQPSYGGQPHELLVTSGAFAGSPSAGVPFTGYGARKNSKHSRYVVGVPAPTFMLRQPMNLAPGAIPI